jgi:hypothetical protein
MGPDDDEDNSKSNKKKKIIIIIIIYLLWRYSPLLDRLCGLVVRVPGYRS